MIYTDLRHTCDALRLSENRASRAECIDIVPGLVARLVRVDARYAAGRSASALGRP